jgi:DHA3 family tetracycline resistance protein-like MFS transporter
VRFPLRELKPVPVYLLLTGGYAFLFQMVVNVNLVYQVREAELDPLQLVLIGTALEATVFLCEVPTGVVADVFSRRRSVLIGLVLVGIGLMLQGAVPRFEVLLLAQVVWGAGYTFISGAQQAWIADEVGVDNASRAYLRSAQVEQLMRIVAIPVSTVLATVALNLPILLGGALFLPLALLLRLVMPERGFKAASRDERPSFAALGATFAAGGRLVRRSPLLMTVFGIAAFLGMASEGFDRLWVKHFYDNLGFPALGEFDTVVWIGVVRMGSAVLGIGAVELVRRRFDTTSHAAISRGLFAINTLQIASMILFAMAGGFYVGMVAFWSTVVLSRAFDPLYLAWINQNIESRVRATVISMSSQVDALGQIAGGPMLGAIGSVFSLRAALVGAGVVLSPALLLYTRAFGQGAPEEKTEEPTPA